MSDTTKSLFQSLAIYLFGFSFLALLAISLMAIFGEEKVHNPYMVFGFPLIGIAQHLGTDRSTAMKDHLNALVLACPLLILFSLHIAILDHYTLQSLHSVWDGPIGVTISAVTTGPLAIAFHKLREPGQAEAA